MNRIQQYENVCEGLVKEFMRIYYPDYTQEDDYYWIGGEVGGVCGIGDEYWTIDNFVDALRYKPTHEQLFNWYYDEHLKEGGQSYNLKNYTKLKK